MKAHFIKLFDYDRHANTLMADAILQSGINDGKPVQLMAHLLAAQQVWLNRCKNLPHASVALWPDWTAVDLKPAIEQNHLDWTAYLESITGSHIKETIHYKNMRGDSWSTVLEDILTHVINHGTHHRAQAGWQLKFEGAEQLPGLDYILYSRGL